MFYKEGELPLKLYGTWAGNTRGRPYDPAFCAYPVMGNYVQHQCQRKATIGIFCKQHEPTAWRARLDARDARWEAKWRADREAWAAEDRKKKSADAFKEALEKIAKGELNDPVGFAQLILEEWK